MVLLHCQIEFISSIIIKNQIMKKRLFLLLTSALVIASSCSYNEDLDSESDVINPYSFESVYDGVNFKITPSATKAISEIDQYTLEASYEGIDSKTIVSVTKIDDNTSYVEHLSLDGTLIASMKIVNKSIVSVDYNENITDDALGIPQTKSLRDFTKCVGERYKQLREVVDSDGELMILCDVLIAVCPAEMVTASAIKCLIG